MKGLLRTFATATVFVLLLAGASAAEIPGMILDWGPYANGWEPGYMNHMSMPGAQLTIVGEIDRFFDPFLDLDPNTTEFTFIFRDLVSLGSIDLGGIILTSYAGGFFDIYMDVSNNADFGTNPPNAVSPSTFIDGQLILSGFLTNFSVQQFQGPGGWSGTYDAGFEFTGPAGGTYYDRVEQCYGTTGGGWSDSAGGIPVGYNFQVDGHMTVTDCRPTATETTSWGSVKEMFR